MPLEIEVLNASGAKVDTAQLPESVFGARGNSSVVHEVVTAYLANTRRGTHSAKTRAEVRGGGHKPWRQKGTGRARAGSIRSPLWRKGGVIFAPKPRDYNQPVSPAKRHLALRLVLSDSLRGGKLGLLDGLEVAEPKTKKVAEILKKIKAPRKTLLVVEKSDEKFDRASRNIKGLAVRIASDLNSYHVLAADKVFFTRGAAAAVARRLSGGAGEPAKPSDAAGAAK